MDPYCVDNKHRVGDLNKKLESLLSLEGKPPIRLSKSKFTKKEQDNKDVIVEIRNCAMFLAAALAMVGQKGPVSFDKSLEIREDVATNNPILSTFGNFATPPNISPRILGKPIGKEGKRVTYDDILSMLRDIPLRAEEDTGYLQSPVYARHPDRYIEYTIDLLSAARGMVGKKGHCYFEHGIVTSHNRDVKFDKKREAMGSIPVIVEAPFDGEVTVTGDLLRIPIGRAGRKVTMEHVISAFHEVSMHAQLVKFRKSGRAYYHEGFVVLRNGRTMLMTWGS